jgi:hypothetical protein
LGVTTTLRTLAAGRRFGTDVERVIFALVANRALEPTSKLAATRWVAERAWVPGLPEVSDDACYRAMDWLLEVHDELAERVYWATADLLNLEVDLLFFDTTSTYFETDTADPPGDTDDGQVSVGFRSYEPGMQVLVAEGRASRRMDGVGLGRPARLFLDQRGNRR